jgi:hypothetical protein
VNTRTRRIETINVVYSDYQDQGGPQQRHADRRIETCTGPSTTTLTVHSGVGLTCGVERCGATVAKTSRILWDSDTHWYIVSDELTQLIDRYRHGESIRALVTQFRRPRSFVITTLIAADVPIRADEGTRPGQPRDATQPPPPTRAPKLREHITVEERDHLLQYRQGVTVRDLVKQFPCLKTVVLATLIDADVPIRAEPTRPRRPTQ